MSAAFDSQFPKNPTELCTAVKTACTAVAMRKHTREKVLVVHYCPGARDRGQVADGVGESSPRRSTRERSVPRQSSRRSPVCRGTAVVGEVILWTKRFTPRSHSNGRRQRRRAGRRDRVFSDRCPAVSEPTSRRERIVVGWARASHSSRRRVTTARSRRRSPSVDRDENAPSSGIVHDTQNPFNTVGLTIGQYHGRLDVRVPPARHGV